MHLNRYGDTSKETIVLIHGIPGAAASWAGVVEALQPDHDIVVPTYSASARAQGRAMFAPKPRRQRLRSL